VADRVTREIAARAGKSLVSSGRSVAVTESCTGGGVCEALTSVPGSSEYFLGGIVAYGNESKIRESGVPSDLIESVGAVSREVAEAMAAGAANRFGADIGIGTTGIAGPGGGTPEKPVGTVYIAIVSGEVRLSYPLHLPGDRDAVRGETVRRVLEMLISFLSGGERGGR
jgi:nicotinamide-nucleotide amidase